MSDDSLIESGDPYADNYGAAYSIYGDLDVDRLLAEARPQRAHDVWRTGDPGPGYTCRSSGVRIDICQDRTAVEAAVVRFLLEERAFLLAAARFVSPTTWSVLTCRMWVYAVAPSQIVLSPAALQHLAACHVDLTVVGYPCADHPGP